MDFSADPVRRNSPEAARAQFGQLTSLSSAGLLYQYIVNAPSANDLVPVLAIVAANPNVFDKGTLQACNDRLKTFFADQEAASNEDITALSAAISKARNPLLP